MWLVIPLASSKLAEGFRSFSQGERSPVENWLMIGVIAVIVLGSLAFFFWDRRRQQEVRKESAPESLFEELCTLHRLSRPESALLLRTAQSQHPAQPALVFVNESILAEQLPTADVDAAAWNELRLKLFGE